MLETPDIPQQTRKKYIKLLYKMCGHHILLPTAMQIPISYDRKHSISYRGGFADVWKGEHCGRDVAVKVVRTYSDSNLQKILGVSCLLHSILCAGVLTVPYAEILQRGCSMEDPPSSKRPPSNWGEDVRERVCNDIGLDGEW